MGLAAVSLWVMGGIIAILLSVLSPEFYRKTFVSVPEDLGPMIRYAWVGGSISGVTYGGIAVMIIGTVLFRNTHGKKKAV